MIRHNRCKQIRSKGASAVEMAVVAPIFVALMMGQLESSRLGMVAQLLTTAAREACRVAVVPGHTQSDVQARVDAVLSGSGISVGSVTPTAPSGYSWDTAPQGTAITVSLSVPYSQVTWLGTPFFLNGATVAASATMSSENP
jgi:Flp pilus assembly protein TadG